MTSLSTFGRVIPRSRNALVSSSGLLSGRFLTSLATVAKWTCTPPETRESLLTSKRKTFFDKDKVEAYDEHLMQLAAYRVGLGLPEAQCANVFVSRRVAGLTKMIEWTETRPSEGLSDVY
jgi:hypothetical protein